jgi:hypothetical protein
MIPVFAPKFGLAGVIAGLFAAGEQGAWYDPSDLSTLFQDSAGTVPVTAVEQPVGLILDKSGRGNHATQATATSRPVLQQDASGRYYLSFDGVDDFLQTSSINFTSTDKMTVFAGVRKLLDSSIGFIAELSVNSSSNSGVFSLSVSSNTYNWRSRGTESADTGFTGVSAPSTNVITGIGDIPAPISAARNNGALLGSVTTTQGTGNYGNYQLYIGRRAGIQYPFNGRIYGLIVRGAQSTEQQITSTENWINQRTGAF